MIDYSGIARNHTPARIPIGSTLKPILRMV